MTRTATVGFDQVEGVDDVAWSSVAEIFASGREIPKLGRGRVLGQQLLQHDVLLEAPGPSFFPT